MTREERRQQIIDFSRKADKFSSEIAPYEGKGLRYVITGANAAYAATGKIDMMSIPEMQKTVNSFDSAYKIFLDSVAANIAVIEFIEGTQLKKGYGGAAECIAEFKLTSVFDGSADDMYKEVVQGKSVCVCYYLADNIAPSSRAYIGIFACLA